MIDHPARTEAQEGAASLAGSRAIPSAEFSIVIPTFNEIGNLVELIKRIAHSLAGVSWEVIIVDDDSPDGTAARAKELGRDDGRIRCLRRIDRRGLAGACIEGMLSSSAPYVGVMDADLQHDETILPKMLAMMRSGEADLVVGSRYTPDGSIGEGFSRWRARISHWATRVARMALKTDVKDLMSGFFAIRRDHFDAVAPHLSASGFKILVDIIASAPTPLRVAEVGYTFRERVAGESKLDNKVALDFVALMINKTTGGLIPIRFAIFAAVGTIGVAVHLAVLRSTMLTLPAAGFAFAQGLAAFVAMTSNFFLNNWITYRDQKLKGSSSVLRGLLFFYSVCSLGVIANLGVATFVFDRTATWWFAGLAGLVSGSVWNFTLSSLFVWPRMPGSSRKSNSSSA
jgi:dolichol-phosphate mannosyltransferase